MQVNPHGKLRTSYGEFGPGTVARSLVLPGFEVAVDEVWAAAQQ